MLLTSQLFGHVENLIALLLRRALVYKVMRRAPLNILSSCTNIVGMDKILIAIADNVG